MTEPRPHCYVCDKPLATCVCGHIQRLDNRTSITILQHPRERRHPLGTARFAQLGLQGVRVLVDVEGRYRGPTPPVNFPPRTGVLFPSFAARPLPRAGDIDAPEHLIVIDGTWHQAKTLYRDMGWLRDLPHYVLSPDAPSRYRIRREPQHDYISTLEALLLAIVHLEPELGGVERLLGAFDSMIDQQIACERTTTSHRQRLARRARAHSRKPRALAEQFENLVLVYAETVPGPLSHGAPATGDETHQALVAKRRLVYFCAHRLRDDSIFERWIGTSAAPVPTSVLAATAAEGRARSEQLVSLSEFERQLAEFVGPSDAFAAWGPTSLEALPRQHRRPAGRAVSLKAAFGAMQLGFGPLETIIESLGLATKPWPVPGRGGQRLSHARAVAELIHTHAEDVSLFTQNGAHSAP